MCAYIHTCIYIYIYISLYIYICIAFFVAVAAAPPRAESVVRALEGTACARRLQTHWRKICMKTHVLAYLRKNCIISGSKIRSSPSSCIIIVCCLNCPRRLRMRWRAETSSAVESPPQREPREQGLEVA